MTVLLLLLELSYYLHPPPQKGFKECSL